MRRLLLPASVFCINFLLACGGGGTSGSSTTSTTTCSGATAASASESGFTLGIPADSISSCQNASPTLATSTTTSDAISSNETLVSSTAYVVTMNTTNNEAVVSDHTVTVEVPFDSSLVPAADLDDVHVYANVLNTDTGVLTPVFGVVGSDKVTLSTNGLPANSKWVAVYNPNEVSTVYTPPTPSLNALAKPEALTDQPNVLGNWAQNTWCVFYDSQDTTLRTTIAQAKSTSTTALTVAQMNDFIQTQVSKAARIAGLVYQNGGFRAPALQVNNYLSRTAQQKFCTGATGPFYNIVINGRSRFIPPWHDLGYDPYGMLYIGSSEVADLATDPLGSTLDAVAHEMAHAIFVGYDLISDSFQGLNEGMATTIGSTLGNGYYLGLISETSARWSNLFKAYVRSANATETYVLSNSLNTKNVSGSEAYSNQDFYAYIANLSHSGDLSYLATVFEDLYEDLNARVLPDGFSNIAGWARNGNMTNTMIYADISTALTSDLGSSLSNLYAAFTIDRAYDHSSTSALRGSDLTTAAISTGLFGSSAITSATYTPTQLKNSETTSGSLPSMTPFSSQLLIISAQTTTTESLAMQITLSDTAGSKSIGDGSEDLKAYVRGANSAVSLSSGHAVISEWGKTNTTAYVIVSNNSSSSVTIAYSIGAVTSTTPTLSIVSCPTTLKANTTGTITFNYSDADGDIQTLTESVSSSLGNATAAGDISSSATGTSGSFSGPIFFSGSPTTSITAIATYFLTDSKGNNSDAVSCRITVIP